MEIFAKNNIGIWKFASKTIFELVGGIKVAHI